MKRKFLSFTVILLMAVTLTQCSKSDLDAITPADTSTRLNVHVTSSGINAAGATVTLYSSEASFLNETGHVAAMITNASGDALFKNLISGTKYYFRVESGCKDNDAGTKSTLTGLVNGIINNASTEIISMGTLKFVNNSSNPYKIYINGIVAVNSMAGGTSGTLHMPAMFYTIRVLQISGYILTPTDQTYTGTLTCGGTLTTTFP